MSTPTSSDVILSFQDLDIRFTLRGQVLNAIRGVSLDVYRGESLAIVGESGSGKSVFTKSAMGLLDANGSIAGGHIWYDGKDLTTFTREKEWLTIRGREIAMVMQDPMTSLNPLKTVGDQILEAVLLHQDLRGAQARQAAVEALAAVGIDDPQRRYKQYPHEFSGGMRQRVVIAIAVACRPKILICDEPTTALDVTIQAQILELMKELQKDFGMSILFITHDLGTVARMCDRVAVMYLGRIVESATALEIFKNPQHPYTKGLIGSVHKIGTKNQEKLFSIEGTVPLALNLPAGCGFYERCTQRIEGVCNAYDPTLVQVGQDHQVACFACTGCPKDGACGGCGKEGGKDA